MCRRPREWPGRRRRCRPGRAPGRTGRPPSRVRDDAARPRTPACRRARPRRPPASTPRGCPRPHHRLLDSATVTVKTPSPKDPAVKKLVVLATLAAVAAVAWRKYQSSRAEEDLWIEATRDETLDLR